MPEFQIQSPSPAMRQISAGIPAAPNPGGVSLIIKIFGIIIVAAAMGTAALLFTRFWDPLWNPFRPQPEKVVSESLAKMQGLKTWHFQTNIESSLVDVSQSPVNFSLALTGDSDITDPKNPKADVALDFKMKGRFSADMNASSGLAAEFRSLNGYSYVRINSLNIPLGIDLSSVTGKWVKAQNEVVAGESGRLQEDLAAEIKKIFSEDKIYYVTKEFPDEEISGKKAYHYFLVLDNIELKKAISEILEFAMGPSQAGAAGESQYISQFFLGGMKEIVNEAVDNIGEIGFHLWIGKKDEMIYRMILEKEVDLGRLGLAAGGNISLKVATDLSNFNEAEKIEEPTESIPLEPILLLIQRQTIDSETKLSMDQIKVTADSLYENSRSYYNVSCQRDKTVKTLCNNIKTNSGKSPVIFQSKSKYCAYVELLTKSGEAQKYVCADSSGANAETTVNPGERGYCTRTTFVCPGQ